MSTQDERTKALSKAKIQLMARPDSAFFTAVCFSLKHVWGEEIPTACTDGTAIHFNPSFFMGLGLEERLFLLLHETLHVAYLHIDKVRRGTRDPHKWNIAADHVINLQLIERGFKMPASGLADMQYAGKSTEEVYDLLPDDPTVEVPMDLVEGKQSTEELNEQVKEILVRASIQSKMSGDKPGSIPGDIQIFLDRLLEPKLPWNRILQKFLHTFAKNDYTFKKPNRRFFPKHHLPSLHSEALMDIAVAVDISGSVSDAEFNRFVSEICSIFKMIKPEKITLIQFDTKIKSTHNLKNIQSLMQVEFRGRGGTNVTPVIEWVNQNNPQLVLIFTDGEFDAPKISTKNQVIWLIHNNPEFNAPFGKAIHYEASTT